MYMDTAENAPAIVPKDSTKDLGLPEDLQAERIFIHKTANYENYIVVQEGRVVAYTPDIEDEEPLTVLELTDGEKVNDITSVGNTLVFCTTKDLYYVLYKEKAYTFLGSKVPFPYIHFSAKNIIDNNEIVASNHKGFNDPVENNYWFALPIASIPSETTWNSDSKDGKEHENPEIRKCLDALWGAYNTVRVQNLKDNRLDSPIIVRYEVDIYGDSVSSMPILIPCSSTFLTHLKKDLVERYSGQGGTLYQWDESITLSRLVTYNLFAKIDGEFDLSNWSDIITKVRIYISQPLGWGIVQNSSVMTNGKQRKEETTEGGYEVNYYYSSGDIEFRKDDTFDDNLLLKSSIVRLVKEIDVFEEDSTELTSDFRGLLNGEIVKVSEVFDLTAENYREWGTQDMLTGDDMKHYQIASSKMDTYNNHLLLTQPSLIIDYDYDILNAIDVVERDIPEYKTPYIQTYDVTFLVKGTTEDKIVKKRFEAIDNGPRAENVKAFQVFPDARAYKMLVKYIDRDTSGNEYPRYGEFDMRPHPYLDCAYFNGGIDRALADLCEADGIADYPINVIDDMENKLFVSELNKPFIFPLSKRYTFQSKVIGVAVANTALSQGQFGQFPLYVFTEDGIWVMETATDGSFVSQKPLSREVCVNPDSIISIDNVVVFVTNKGVMMIQGSEVMNISPFMNGRHYVPNDSAKSLIARQEGFAEFDKAISDETPFTAFVKKAKVAYDYAGQRLIFIIPKEEGKANFQYIYKIDTQTWHKMSFSDFDLNAPLNSYPECLVLGNTSKDNQCVYDLSTILDSTKKQDTAKGILITRPFDLGMPDVYKSITNIKIRGDYDKGNVKYILQGSDNGRDFYTLNSLRGKSWKMFRIFILADLEPTERISWIDIDFEPRYNNRLR